MMEIEFKKKIFNKIYLPYLNDTNRFLVFYGGAGSGKSVFIAQRCLYHCLKSKYYRLLFCRKVAKTIRNSQFQLFKDLISEYNLTKLFIIRESNMEIQCANNNLMIAVGMDDKEKIKSIQEPTDVWLEEATEFSKEDMMHLNLRLRTAKAPFNQVVMTFNPISTENWIYESMFLKNEFNSKNIQSTYLDNKFIDKEFAVEMARLQSIDENYHKVYALGEWGGAVKGKIYSEWQMCDEIPEGCDIIYGLDFGYNNPTALIKVALKENLIFIHQAIYKSKLTNSDLIRELKALNMGSFPIYADPAEPQRIEEIYRAGINVKPAQKESDSVKKGIDTIKSMQLFVTKDSDDIIKELRNYKWSEDKNGKSLDIPVKFLDHAMDAFRYAVHTHLTQPTGIYRFDFLDGRPASKHESSTSKHQVPHT